MPLYCPDNSEMLSGCYRKQCPDVTGNSVRMLPKYAIFKIVSLISHNNRLIDYKKGFLKLLLYY